MNSTSSSNTYLFKNKNSGAALVGGSTQRFTFSTSNDNSEGSAASFKNVSSLLLLLFNMSFYVVYLHKYLYLLNRELAILSRNIDISDYLPWLIYRLISQQSILADLIQANVLDSLILKVVRLIIHDAPDPTLIMAADCNLRRQRTSATIKHWRRLSTIQPRRWPQTPQSLCRSPTSLHSSATSADKSLSRMREAIATQRSPRGFKRTKN